MKQKINRVLSHLLPHLVVIFGKNTKIQNTLYFICQILPLYGRANATKRWFFGLHSPLTLLEAYIYICGLDSLIFKGYHLLITTFIASSPNFLLNYHQQCLLCIYFFITKFNYVSPKYLLIFYTNFQTQNLTNFTIKGFAKS